MSEDLEVVKDGWGRVHKFKRLSNRNRRPVPERTPEKWADSLPAKDSNAWKPLILEVVAVAESVDSGAEPVSGAVDETSSQVFDVRKKTRNRNNNKPDVRIARCRVCLRRFGYLPTTEEAKMPKSTILDKVCYRHDF